jgi:AraC-like DNA-binding protein
MRNDSNGMSATYWRPGQESNVDVLCASLRGRQLPLLLREEVQIALCVTPVYVNEAWCSPQFVPAGSLVFTNSLECRGFVAASAAALCELRVLLVSPEALHRACTAARHVDDNSLLPRFARLVVTAPDVAEEFSHMMDLLRPAGSAVSTAKGSAEGSAEGSADVGGLLARLVDEYSADSDLLHAPVELPVTATAMNRVVEFLRSHFSDRITLDDMARVAGLSKSHLLRAFRRRYGLSPSEYLMQLRLARALRLIGCGTSICRAAFDAGFADQSHLTRYLRRMIGCTPAGYARLTAPHPCRWMSPTHKEVLPTARGII